MPGRIAPPVGFSARILEIDPHGAAPQPPDLKRAA